MNSVFIFIAAAAASGVVLVLGFLAGRWQARRHEELYLSEPAAPPVPDFDIEAEIMKFEDEMLRDDVARHLKRGQGVFTIAVELGIPVDRVLRLRDQLPLAAQAFKVASVHGPLIMVSRVQHSA